MIVSDHATWKTLFALDAEELQKFLQELADEGFAIYNVLPLMPGLVIIAFHYDGGAMS